MREPRVQQPTSAHRGHTRPIDRLQSGLKNLINNAHSTGTKNTYNSGIKQYLLFCQFIGVLALQFNDIHSRFPLFLVYLQQEKALGYETIKVYAAAVRYWVVANGGPDPGRTLGGAVDPLYRILLQGIQRAAVGKIGNNRKPITLEKLIRFVGAIGNLQLPGLETARLRALMLLSFWGLFRGSELCMKPGEQIFLRHRDIKVKHTKAGIAYLKITLRKTKTSQFKKTHAYIYSNQTGFCAVAAVLNFVKLKETYLSFCQDSHIFSWPGAKMSVKYFNKLIKEVATLLGLKPRHYSSHCFRAGGATTATNRGVAPHIIKQMGRWTSNCFELYVKKPRVALFKAQKSLGYRH